MTEILIDNVEEVIKIANTMISQYKQNAEKSSPNMANSYRGSILGLVSLLSKITDKTSYEYFDEIYSEDKEE